MGDVCTDGRFDLIERFKRDLVEATNIETSPEEMAVLDSILFRMWQMGWLDRLEQPTASPWHRVEEQLPNVGELVVGLDADGHAEITMLSEAKCWLTYGLWIHNLGCYVWWMPLPEPPKEDEA